jgi:hypothetical protein
MQERPSPNEALAGIDEVPWAELDACHDARRLPALFREIAEGTRLSLVAADELFQTVWHQGSLFEATIPACRYVGELAASDLRSDVRTKLISYLLLFGTGTTFVEPSGGALYLEEAEFAARLEAEGRIVAEVRDLVRLAIDRLLGQLDQEPALVQEALLGLAHLGTQPCSADVMVALRGVAEAVPSEKATAARLVLDHLEQRPIRVDLLEQEWFDLSYGDELLESARRGEFSETDWETLVGEMAGRLCASPLDRDGLWARAHLFEDADLLSVDEEEGPLPEDKHCIRRGSDGRWQVFYSDGQEASFSTIHDSEVSACQQVWSRLSSSPRHWDIAAYRDSQRALMSALADSGRPPPTVTEQRRSERSAQRLAALRGLMRVTSFRRVREAGDRSVDVAAVGGYVHYAVSGRSSDPDAFMPLLEYWMVAVSADDTCDEELHLAAKLAHAALAPTLPPDRHRYAADPSRATARRKRAESSMREWLEARGTLPPTGEPRSP